jgi:Fe-S cluster assembly protein SufD
VSVQSYLDDFETFAAAGGRHPEWLGLLRRAAIERFRTLGFPTTRHEDWHFTSVAPIADAEFVPLRAAGGDAQSADLDRFTFGGDDWTHLVFGNGRFAPALSAAALPGRVQATSQAAALGDGVPAVRAPLGTLAAFEHSAFTALNTAFFVDGAFVHLPAQVHLERPIHLLFVADAEAAAGVTHPRVLIVAEPHARATIVESYVALGDATYFTNPVTEVAVGEGAQVTHLRVQRESQRGYHVATTQAHQARDSRYTSFSFATGAALSRTNIYTVLAGPGAETTLNGLYMADGTQHMDHQTRIEHVAPHCTSHEVYKGVLDDAAHGVFNGKVYVHPEAQKTDGKQTNNNLLLSGDAHIDTKPQLEIFADDVKCTHGATVGQLDAVALFYLKSRGLGDDEARILLTYAFAADVLERIEDGTVREALERLTRERFVVADTVTAGAGQPA